MLDRTSSLLLRGLTIVVPIAATGWALVWSFHAIDHAIFPDAEGSSRPPGLGILGLLVLALVVGALAQTRATSGLIDGVERLLSRIPVVKLIHGTIKDFVSAFLGKRKRFDKPVLVRLFEGSPAEVVGFVTCEDLERLGLPGKSAVYFPQSYNLAGNLVFLPREMLVPLALDAAAALTFVMSGGVSTAAESDATERKMHGVQRFFFKNRTMAPRMLPDSSRE